MFKQLFWKFLPRYGMRKTYDSHDRIENDVRTLFILGSRFESTSSYMMGYDRMHIAPRGDCGVRGKVLCYKIVGTNWVYCGKHRKAYINNMNCKDR